MIKFKPLNGKVLLKPISEERVTQGGLIIPDNAAKEQIRQAEVISTDVTKESMLKPGDIVLIDEYRHGIKVELDNETYWVAREEFVIGVLEGE